MANMHKTKILKDIRDYLLAKKEVFANSNIPTLAFAIDEQLKDLYRYAEKLKVEL